MAVSSPETNVTHVTSLMMMTESPLHACLFLPGHVAVMPSPEKVTRLPHRHTPCCPCDNEGAPSFQAKNALTRKFFPSGQRDTSTSTHTQKAERMKQEEEKAKGM